MNLKMLLYCTKAGLILRDYRGKAIVLSPTDRPFTTDDRQPVLNGKIVTMSDYARYELDCTIAIPDSEYDKQYKIYVSENEVIKR